MALKVVEDRNARLEKEFVPMHELPESFCNELFSIDMTKDHVYVALGVERMEHRAGKSFKQSVPVSRLVLTHKTARELAEMLATMVDHMENVTDENQISSLTKGISEDS